MAIALQIKSFTNEFGDVIQPGDQVITITLQYKSVKISKGIFLGMHDGGVVVELPTRKLVWDIPGKYTKHHYEEGVRRSYLRDNRVYPLTTPLAQLVGKSL